MFKKNNYLKKVLLIGLLIVFVSLLVSCNNPNDESSVTVF